MRDHETIDCLGPVTKSFKGKLTSWPFLSIQIVIHDRRNAATEIEDLRYERWRILFSLFVSEKRINIMRRNSLLTLNGSICVLMVRGHIDDGQLGLGM